VRDTTAYERARRDPEGYWADWARQLEWSRPWDRVLDWRPPQRQVVPRRQDQCFGELPRPARARALGDTTTLADPAVVA